MRVRVFNPSRHSIPRVLFSKIAQAVLGRAYSLSIIFIDSKTSRRLNKTYRGSDRPTDILSFSLNQNVGEMYLATAEVRKKARLFGVPYASYLPYLVIHGMLHLKGLAHGRTMESLERRQCRALSIPYPE